MPPKGSRVVVWGQFVFTDGEWGCFKGILPTDFKGYLNSCPKQDALGVNTVVVTREARVSLNVSVNYSFPQRGRTAVRQQDLQCFCCLHPSLTLVAGKAMSGASS